jgi:hypothetical protein
MDVRDKSYKASWSPSRQQEQAKGRSGIASAHLLIAHYRFFVSRFFVSRFFVSRFFVSRFFVSRFFFSRLFSAFSSPTSLMSALFWSRRYVSSSTSGAPTKVWMLWM